MRRTIAASILGTLGVALAYRTLLRQRLLDWGARPDEVARRLPGDDLLEDADLVSTRAVTIDAPTSAIWPWLVQMGPGRAGAYSYDWVENLLGLDMHSADEIVPAWQSIQIGDAWRLGKDQALRAEIVEPERALVVRSEDARWVWALVLAPEGASTRLLSRNRMVVQGDALSRLALISVLEPGSLVMERKMLLGIKSRSERLTRQTRTGAFDAAGSASAPGAPARVDERGLVATV